MSATTLTTRVHADQVSRSWLSAARPAGLFRGLVVLLAIAGVGLALFTIVDGGTRPRTAALGERVPTTFGSLVVTRTNVTFVPTTQGVPTMAKMNGTEGTDQLQVWVRLANTSRAPAPHAARQFELLDEAGHRLHPQGSTLGAAPLPRNATIDAQVWFDLDGQPKGKTRWLIFRDADGTSTRIVLRPARPTATPHQNGADHVHHH